MTSHKKFSEGKQAHVGMEALKTNRTRWEWMTPQHFHTIPTSCAILPPLTQICYVFVSCVQIRVVEGSGVSTGGCVVHFDVHGEWVTYVVGCWNVVAILSMADLVCLECMQKLCSAWAVLGLYGTWGLSYAVKFYCCWNMADVGRLLCVRLEWAKLSTLFIQCIWIG